VLADTRDTARSFDTIWSTWMQVNKKIIHNIMKLKSNQGYSILVTMQLHILA